MKQLTCSLLASVLFTTAACDTAQPGANDTMFPDSVPALDTTPIAAAPPAVGTFRLLAVEDTILTLRWDYDERRVSVRTPTVEATTGGRQYRFMHSDTSYVISIRDSACADAMSGHQYPATVTVAIGTRTLSGCGGEPGSLIRGAEWVVDSLDALPLVPGSAITMQFSPDGRITGSAGCNRFGGNYTVNGNDLTTSQVAVTRKACGTDIDRQEILFLSYLEKPARFYIVGDALHLERDRIPVVIARRRQ
jgi:heat shock protein HslJ